jgi:hypothetical protein
MSKIKTVKTGIDFIKQWVIKTALKQQPKGVLTTLPKKDFVDLNTAITAERLMRNGVDPNAIKNVDQVENIIKGEVFNLQGEKLDPNKPIVGGSQSGKKINREFFERNAEAKELQKRIESGVASTVERILAMEPIDAMKEANKIIGRKGQYKNLSQEDAKKILQDTEDHIFERNVDIDPEDMFADGGRIGLKKGMDRRTFMKIMGGLATLPILGRYFKGAEKAAPVIEKATETVTQAPSYFFDLVAKIKMFGKQSKVGPAERVDEYSYIGKNGDQYTLTEDITTGDAQITKDKMGIGTSGDKSFDVIEDRTVLEYKAPKKDVDPDTQKFIDEGAEYEEYKIEFDQDGTQAGADAIDEIIQKEIIEESKKAAPPIKKAAGGLAYMLGE